MPPPLSEPDARPESDAATRGPRRRGLAWAALLVSSGLMVVLLLRIDWNLLPGLFRSARTGWLAVAAGSVVVLPPLMAWRWRTVLQCVGPVRVPFHQLVRAVLMANVLNSILPGKAGDLVKAFYLREHGGLPGNLGSVLLERTVDVTVLGLLGLAAYALTGHTWGLVTALFLLGGAGAVFFMLQFVPFARWLPAGKWSDAAVSFRAVWHCWIQHPGLAAQTAVASLAVWLLCGSVLGALAGALRQPLAWTESFAVFPLAIMAGLVPITVGGLGTREAVMTELLAPRLSREAATVLSLGYTAFTYWFLSAISLPAVGAEIWRWLRRDQKAAAPAQRRAS